MFAWVLRHVNVYTVAAGGEGRRQGPKRQLTLTRVDVTKVYYKISDFERFALTTESDYFENVRFRIHYVFNYIY